MRSLSRTRAVSQTLTEQSHRPRLGNFRPLPNLMALCGKDLVRVSRLAGTGIAAARGLCGQDIVSFLPSFCVPLNAAR